MGARGGCPAVSGRSSSHYVQDPAEVCLIVALSGRIGRLLWQILPSKPREQAKTSS